MSLNSLRARRDIRRDNNSDYVMANLDELVRSKAASEGDTEFLQLLDAMEDLSLLEQAVGSHYDIAMTSANRGAKVDRDKAKLIRKKMHGGSNELNALNARAMALDTELYGPIVQRAWAQGESPGDIRLRRAVDRVLSSSGASELAGVGLRDVAAANMSPEERLLRAGDRIIELDHGYNPVTGAPYAGQGLDGGHKIAHNVDHSSSALRENMMFENKYENRAKGERSGPEAAAAFYNSLRGKVLGTAKREPKVSAARFAKIWPVGEGY